MNGRCVRCNGMYVRSHDEVACSACGFQVVVPVRAWDRSGDVIPADWIHAGLQLTSNGKMRRPHSNGQDRGDGCHLHAHCLTCPLPECIHDQTQARERHPLDHQSRAAIRQMLLGTTMSHELIACRVGCSRGLVTKVKREMDAEVPS